MSDEDKTLILGKILGKMEILVPALTALDKKLDESDKALAAEISNLKAKVYWISGILTLLYGSGFVF